MKKLKKICPKCGEKLVNILYGMPSIEAIEAEKQKTLYLGGCEESEKDPIYHCFKCNRNYYKNLKEDNRNV